MLLIKRKNEMIQATESPNLTASTLTEGLGKPQRQKKQHIWKQHAVL